MGIFTAGDLTIGADTLEYGCKWGKKLLGGKTLQWECETLQQEKRLYSGSVRLYNRTRDFRVGVGELTIGAETLQ